MCTRAPARARPGTAPRVTRFSLFRIFGARPEPAAPFGRARSPRPFPHRYSPIRVLSPACQTRPHYLHTFKQKAWHGHGAICPGTRRIRSIQIIVCMWALHHIGSCPTIGSERGRIGPGNNHLSGGWRPPRLLWPEKSASSLPDACLSARMALSLRN